MMDVDGAQPRLEPGRWQAGKKQRKSGQEWSFPAKLFFQPPPAATSGGGENGFGWSFSRRIHGRKNRLNRSSFDRAAGAVDIWN
jgi:hypothetical protein